MTSPVDASLANRFPTPREVDDFHRNADKDKNQDSLHHTLGPGRYQASPGDHVHDGGTSFPLFTDVTFTGSKTNNVSSILSQIIAALVAKGARDETTP